MGQVSLTADIWTDQCSRSFLALTAHWIAKVEKTTSLEYKTALVAFHRLPGKHDGSAIAEAVIKLLDRAHITVKVRLLYEVGVTMHVSDVSLKVGHITMDNASNNGTMMEKLAEMLRARDIDFDADDRRVMCFAHIINLCTGQVVASADSKVDKKVDDDGNDSPQSDDEISMSPPIARARNVVRAIRVSSTRRDGFDYAIDSGNAQKLFDPDVPKLQLLLDVRTRWDSTYYMVTRLRAMRQV